MRRIIDVFRESKDPLELNQKGEQLARKGKYKRALSSFEKAVDLDPYYIQGWLNMGYMLARLNKKTQAENIFNKVLELDPNCSEAWVAIASNVIDLNNKNKLIECYDNALEIDPENVDALYYKDAILIEMKEYSRAVELLDKSIEIMRSWTSKSPNYYIWLTKGAALVNQFYDAFDSKSPFKREWIIDAIECYGEVVRKAPQSSPERAQAMLNLMKMDAIPVVKDQEMTGLIDAYRKGFFG